MLNLEPRLDNRLWAAIEHEYESGNYTGAILDSIHFLGELIREKTGLEGDGVALVGQALGGQNPKLKVTKLQTESEQNVQKGIEQFLRGMYQGIRNPRSHEKYVDSSEDAETLLLFVNYLVRVIDKAKGPFDKEAFLQQVFDPAFAEDSRYADALVERIPQGKRWAVLLDVYRRKEEGKGQKLSYFFAALLKALSVEEVDEFCGVVSQELETTSEDATIRFILLAVPSSLWPKYSEVARIRTEGKVIDAIKDGKYDPTTKRYLSGAFGSWVVRLGSPLVLKDRLAAVASSKLCSSDSAEQAYALNILPRVVAEFPTPPLVVVRAVRQGLKAGDPRFRDAMLFVTFFDADDPWTKAFKSDVESFVEAQEASPGVTDDDVPF